MSLIASLEHNRHAVLLHLKVMHSDNKPVHQYNNGFEYGVKHILSPKSGSLKEILVSELNLSAELLEDLLQLGSIYFEGQRQLSDKNIAEGDYIRVHTKPRRFPHNNYQWKERIIFEDENFIVVNKPAGLPVHPSVDNCRENLQMYLSDHLQQEIFITHRLDVPTSGLIVLAKSRDFLPLFNHLLAQRGVQKIYRARVHGLKLKEGLYTHYMEPSPRAPKVVSLEAKENWQECHLRLFDVRDFKDDQEQEVRVELLTGRTHQIRAQLSTMGAPICGDIMYGAPKKYDLEMIDLEAEYLKFLEFEFTVKR
ncbi:RluA family pseudouridine synthase [Bdellovibrio sp. HCB337]|uniref:RluA family pseudouridine synthase n=1 Tax=Bdellovibrio sp. HCB337 TaxID=3394358 RepID=UPI0039A6A5EE